MPRPLPIVLLVLLAAARALAGEPPDPVADALEKMKSDRQETRLAGIAAAASLADPKITTQLVKLLGDRDWHVRLLTVEALGTRTGEEDGRKAATALAARLPALRKGAASSEEYGKTIGALAHLARPESVKALVDIGVDEPRETAKACLLAAANAPCPEAVDELIGFLAKGRNKGRAGQRQFGVEALKHLTGENLGHDPDKWRAWWKENRATFDLKAVKAEREAKAAQAAEREKEKKERKEKREKKEREAEGV